VSDASTDVLDQVLAAPKRGRGRPRKDGTPPPAPAGKRERKPAKRQPKAGEIKSLLATTLVAGDALAGLLAPRVWTQDDRLQPSETTLLVDAIYTEIAQYPGVLAWLAAASGVSTHLNLALVLATVALPRLARHGLVPGELAYLAAAAGLAAGGALGGDRPDRDGQVDAVVGAAPAPAVPADLQEQAGLGALWGADVSQGEGYGQPADIAAGAAA